MVDFEPMLKTSDFVSRGQSDGLTWQLLANMTGTQKTDRGKAVTKMFNVLNVILK